MTLFYRKGIKDAPAYRQNHEEISEALEEGIALAEFMSLVGANADEFGHLVSVDFQNTQTKAAVNVSLRNLYVAAGTSPNTIYQSEYPDTFVMDKWFFQRYS